MKKILVLGSLTTDAGETAELKRYVKLIESSTAEDLKCFFAHFDDLSFVISPAELKVFDYRNDQELNSYDLVILRGKVRPYIEIAYCVCQYLKIKKVPFINNYLKYRPASKVQQAITFHKLQVPFPITIYSKNPSILEKTIRQNLKFPVIIKDSFGAHGKNNYLAKTPEELKKILTDNENVKFIAQEYIPNDCDYRILLVGNQTVIIRRAAGSGSHLNNTTLGAKAELVESKFFTPGVLAAARKIADNALMSIAGVDVLYDPETENFYFLEINSQPQILTGAFTDVKKEAVGKYIDYLLSKAE